MLPTLYLLFVSIPNSIFFKFFPFITTANNSFFIDKYTFYFLLTYSLDNIFYSSSSFSPSIIFFFFLPTFFYFPSLPTPFIFFSYLNFPSTSILTYIRTLFRHPPQFLFFLHFFNKNPLTRCLHKLGVNK